MHRPRFNRVIRLKKKYVSDPIPNPNIVAPKFGVVSEGYWPYEESPMEHELKNLKTWFTNIKTYMKEKLEKRGIKPF